MSTRVLIITFCVLVVSVASRRLKRLRLRQALLLGCCYAMYGAWAGLPFLLLLIASSMLNHALGAAIRRWPSARSLWMGLGFNIALLATFKYLPSLANVWPSVLGNLEGLERIALPLGISFWTFQAISYLVDVYLEKEETGPSLLEFSLYMAFWPTVISGPVCRLPQLLPQFRQKSEGFREDMAVGAVRCIQGLFMKLVLAQLLGAGLSPGHGVAAGFDETSGGWSGLDVWALALGYAFQLFFDFAGYSLIVIGAARLLGFRLPENFDRPYLSATPSIFWTRWHMSLSFWIRDYVYVPLVSLRRERWWPYVALCLSMVIFGFWHQAKLTFVVWGAYHGAVLVAHRVGQAWSRGVSVRPPVLLARVSSWAITFMAVLVGYVLFRANSVRQAIEMLGSAVRLGAYRPNTAILSTEYYAVALSLAAAYFAYEGAVYGMHMWSTNKTRLHASAMTMRRGVGRDIAVAALDFETAITRRQWWWSVPPLALLVAVTALTFIGQSGNLAPFLYLAF